MGLSDAIVEERKDKESERHRKKLTKQEQYERYLMKKL